MNVFLFFGDNLKKLTYLLITILGIYVIYSLYCNNSINYVSLTDSNNNFDIYIYEYLSKNKTNRFNNYFNSSSIIQAYQNIRNNQTIRVNNTDYYLKKVLRESDILVISIGMDELSINFNKYNMQVNYAYFDKMYDNIIRLVKEIKRYAYGKIIFLGYYNPTNYYDANIDRFFYDINIKLERLMIDNNIIYLDLYELVKGNRKAYKEIANGIKYYF